MNGKIIKKEHFFIGSSPMKKLNHITLGQGRRSGYRKRGIFQKASRTCFLK